MTDGSAAEGEVRAPHAEGVDGFTQQIHHGDAFDVLDELPDESVHAVVTDPPYGLAFMGRDWDTFDPKGYQEWCERWASKARRVLKPGGHLLAFSGNRTHHRLFTGVEDAGFEVRDTVTWHYGNGFPKHSDMFLKPATEFIVLSRNPFGGSARECHNEHETAYLNIDECRVGDEPSPSIDRRNRAEDADKRPGHESDKYGEAGSIEEYLRDRPGEELGRYPANVAFGECAAEALDVEVGDTHGGDQRGMCEGDRLGGFADVGAENGDGEPNARVYDDEGGPSRYFYTSKATRAERTEDGQIKNDHPTVKPLDLMEWLVKLVAREGQIVLDPFAGTGTTCKAARSLNRRFIGVEKQAQYVAVAQARAGVTVDEPRHLTDSETPTLRAFTDGGTHD